MDPVLIVAVVVAALVAVLLIRAQRSPPARRPGPASTPRLQASTSFPREVAGEGFHQEALSRLCGGKCAEGYELRRDALLVPEPDNPHDVNAVRVTIDGETVGHLPRDDAAQYVAQLARLGRSGEVLATGAKIVGGWKRPGDEGAFGVYLAFTWPLRISD